MDGDSWAWFPIFLLNRLSFRSQMRSDGTTLGLQEAHFFLNESFHHSEQRLPKV